MVCEKSLLWTRLEKDEKDVSSALVQTHDVLLAELVALELRNDVADHVHQPFIGPGAVDVLDLADLRNIDGQDREEAVLPETSFELRDVNAVALETIAGPRVRFSRRSLSRSER